jgi:hypothetical protein
LGTTGHDGKLGIALSDQTCKEIQAAKGCGDRTETTYAVSLGDDGQAQINVTRRYYGPTYNSRNRYFSELPPEERNRYYQEVVSTMAQGAKPLTDLTTRFDTYPGIEQYKVAINNYSVVDGKYLYFDLPFSPSLFPPGSDRRTLPLFLRQRNESTVRTEIELPPGYQKMVIAPRSEKFTAPDDCGRALITATDSAGKCVITHQFDTAPAIIEPKDYSSLLKVQSAVSRKSSKVFLLEK